MLVTLPFVLLLLDCWPLKRFHFQSTNVSLGDFFTHKHLLIEKISYKKLFFSLSSIIVLIILSLVTWRQVTYWENGLTISKRAISVTPDNWPMENKLANMLVTRGELKKGIWTNNLLLHIMSSLHFIKLRRTLIINFNYS